MKLAIIIGALLSVLFTLGVMSQFEPEPELRSYHQIMKELR